MFVSEMGPTLRCRRTVSLVEDSYKCFYISAADYIENKELGFEIFSI